MPETETQNSEPFVSQAIIASQRERIARLNAQLGEVFGKMAKQNELIMKLKDDNKIMLARMNTLKAQLEAITHERDSLKAGQD